MKHSEIVAKAIIETLIPGATLSFQCDQSTSRPDFDLLYADGTVATVEVTSSTDAKVLKTNAAITNSKQGGHEVKAQHCKKSWMIWPRDGANIKMIRKNADIYLHKIEVDGIESFGLREASDNSDVQRICKELGVVSGSVITGTSDCYIRISFPIRGGAIGPPMVHKAIICEAMKEDNRHKLGSALSPEKHLAVYICPDNHLIWTPFVYLAPPDNVVELPPEITHVWALGEGQAEHQYVVWRAQAGKHWSDLGKVYINSLPLI